MTLRTLVSTVILAILPGIAIAEGCSRDAHTASTCESGQVWDATSKSCVESVSS